MFKGLAEAIWITFILCCVLYACTDRHIVIHHNNEIHDIWINKEENKDDK